MSFILVLIFLLHICITAINETLQSILFWNVLFIIIMKLLFLFKDLLFLWNYGFQTLQLLLKCLLHFHFCIHILTILKLVVRRFVVRCEMNAFNQVLLKFLLTLFEFRGLNNLRVLIWFDLLLNLVLKLLQEL